MKIIHLIIFNLILHYLNKHNRSDPNFFQNIPSVFKLTGKEHLSKFKTNRDLVASYYNTCQINYRNRILSCWGSEMNDILKIPKKAKNVLQVTLGEGHSCAISNEDLILSCWGLNNLGQSSVPEGFEKSLQVAAGLGFTCTYNEFELFTCWGLKGLIYDGVHIPITASIPQIALWQSQMFTVGSSHICTAQYENFDKFMDHKHKSEDANDTDESDLILLSKILCWGLNDQGQLDIPDKISNLLINHQLNFMESSFKHNCAILDSQLLCWGNNQHSQTSPPMSGGFKQQLQINIFLGRNHSCGMLLTGKIQCWGSNEEGQLDVPQMVEMPVVWASGGNHNCAQQIGKEVWCWGSNEQNQCQVPLLYN